MLEYWQSYEIDGSDTNYNIVFTEREKCVELLAFYLKLKTIHKGIPVKITRIKGENYKTIVNTEFSHDCLDPLWDIIKNPEVQLVELMYSYVPENSLYPEVKRELIDMLLKQSGKTFNNFVNPMFLNSLNARDYITVSLENKPNYFDYETACSTNYYNAVVKNPFMLIDFNCMLSGPKELNLYGITKIKEAFPEFEIDLKESEELIAYYDVNWADLINEGIVIESTDHAFTIDRILNNKAVKHIEADKAPIYLRNLPMGFEKFGENMFEYEGFGEGPIIEPKVKAKFMALKGIIEDRTMSIQQYVEKFRKLAAANIFSNSEVEAYTSFSIDVQITKDEKCRCVIQYTRSETDLQLLMIVPHKVRAKIIRLLSL